MSDIDAAAKMIRNMGFDAALAKDLMEIVEISVNAGREQAAAEIADLTKANGLLHGIVSNREEEISDLRGQLALSEERVSKLQAHPGERYWEGRWRDADRALASARKALEMARPYVTALVVADAPILKIIDAAIALTDEKST